MTRYQRGLCYTIMALLIAVWWVAWAITAHASGTLPAQLDWINSDTLNPIQIEKGSALSGPFTKIVTVPAGTITDTDATNAPGDTACYRVAYANPSGVGPYAGPVCKTFPTIPVQSPGTFTVK